MSGRHNLPCLLLPFLALITAVALQLAPTAAHAQAVRSSHALTMDDVLAMQRLDQAAISPDGTLVAFVIQRPALPGEVFGRNAYETDPSRLDVVLVSLRSGERREITDGAANAAGFWCVSWSPDGRRLAMLSTQSEGDEPRGGDNVRIYVWDREENRLGRLADEAVPTQMRYGGPWEELDFRGGGDGGTLATSCGESHEHAPFTWLDDHRLLAATLPPGAISALLDRYSRPARVAMHEATAIHDGTIATGRAVGSGKARVAPGANGSHAALKIFDLRSAKAETIARVPTYPFRGALTVSVSPDRSHIAVLATVGALQPQAGRTFPNAYDPMWTVERRLGIASLSKSSAIAWTSLPESARYPLALYEWSPDSSRIVMRARADPFGAATALFTVAGATGAVKQVTAAGVEENGWGNASVVNRPVLWTGPDRFVAKLPPQEFPESNGWALVDIGGEHVACGHGSSNLCAELRRTENGNLVTMDGDKLVRLAPDTGTFSTVATLSREYAAIGPEDRGRPSDVLLVARSDDSGSHVRAIAMDGPPSAERTLPDGAIMEIDPHDGTLIVSEKSRGGIRVRGTAPDWEAPKELLALDTFLSTIDWGETRLIDYESRDGTPLKGAAILPPDYRPGTRYPTLLWVYQGYQVHSLENDYFLDPFMPGFYNLQLYAARGYVVLIPSIRYPSSADEKAFFHISDDVLPAADKLIELGIADPERLGVFGQSRGGYTVMALAAQTDRFKAGVALAGISDLSAVFGEFDEMARGYPGIAHEKSDNWAEAAQFGLHKAPWQQPDAYAAVSPLTYVDQVQMPLMLIHGDRDLRGAMSQSERFFYALYAQGKTAQLVRYGGESHSLAQSPANVRDIFERTVDWFDRFLEVEGVRESRK